MPPSALDHLRPPGPCEVCRQWSGVAICRACLDRHAAAQPRCGRCGLRLGTAAAACGACLRDPPPFERAVVGVDYGFPWDHLVAEFKFRGRSELAGSLASLMLDAVQRASPPQPQWVLPVPLAPARLAERGYNQAWELARRLARSLGLPTDPTLLLRPADQPHQAELDRAARLRNLRHAFMVDPDRRGWLQGARVALVDDVMTTGATVVEAAQVLRRAGAAAVDVWVLARTPAPGA